ncbi:MAG TPA: class I SAM-dependent methyltransferase [Bacteroidales bacterium]|nr:class I SAM-dependent methyltransferase [Bacteroidales bacterium]
MNKVQLSNILRKLGLLLPADYISYHFRKFNNRKANRKFKLNNPSVLLPPDYLIYESFQINYQKFYSESIDSAIWLKTQIGRHIELSNIRILDWGCGPGRIVRHLPKLINVKCQFFGTDYNIRSIEWCKKNLPDINFTNNTLEANLPYPDGYFDVIYGISVFTHLSERLHFEWYSELSRVLKNGGIMLVTTHGENFKIKLTKKEKSVFNENKLVERGNTKEGHRTFSSFQPKGFMMRLFKDSEIVEHVEPKPKKNRALPQDIWVIRKKNNTVA